MDAPGGVTPGDDQGGDDDGSGGTPTLNVSLDKPTFATELGTDNVATLTLTGAGGFSGAVTVTPTVTDAATGSTLSDWTVALDSSSVTLDVNGTATVKAKVSIPTLMSSLSANLSLAVSSSAGTQSYTSAFTVANQYTFVLTLNNGKCVYPNNYTAGVVQTLNVAVGTKIRWLNMTQTDNDFIVHIDGGIAGLSHESQVKGQGTKLNEAYEQTPTAAGNTGWYCHTEGDVANADLRIQAN